MHPLTLTAMGTTAATLTSLALAPPTTGTPRIAPVIRVIAGLNDVWVGRDKWEALPNNWQNARFGIKNIDITGTTTDEIYQPYAVGATTLTIPIPEPGRYRVELRATETYWHAPRKRLYHVDIEGTRTFTNVDLYARAGHGHAVTLWGSTDITDGEANLTFTALADLPLISSLKLTKTSDLPGHTPTPTPTTPLSTDQIVTLGPSYTRTRIDNAPLDPNSDAIIKKLARSIRDRFGGNAAFNAYQYTTSFYKVDYTTPRHTVAFHDCQNKGKTPPGIHNRESYFLDVPIPTHAVVSNDTDSSLALYHPGTDQLWEFWKAAKTPTGWQACWGGRIDRISTQQPIFPYGWGSSATGLSLATTMVTVDEIRNGRITHAMALDAVYLHKNTISWPANRTDGWSYDPAAIPAGSRLRLDPTLNLDDYDLTPIGKIIAKGAQEYGFVIVNTGGAVAVHTQNGDTATPINGKNPWDTLLEGKPQYMALTDFPWKKMQLIKKDWKSLAFSR